MGWVGEKRDIGSVGRDRSLSSASLRPRVRLKVRPEIMKPLDAAVASRIAIPDSPD